MDKSVQSSGPSECIRFFKAAVQSVLPKEMVRDSLRLSDDGELLINGQSVKVIGKIVVLAFGKAVFGMVQAVEDILGNRLSGGVASVPIGTLTSAHGKALKKVTAMEGGLNNSPDELSHKAATAIHSLAESLTADDVAIVLISGNYTVYCIALFCMAFLF
jgi:glycerate 2-kinase